MFPINTYFPRFKNIIPAYETCQCKNCNTQKAKECPLFLRMLDIIGRLEDLINRLRRKIRGKAQVARSIIFEEDLEDGIWGQSQSDFEEEEVNLSQADSSDQAQENIAPGQQ